MGKERLEFLIWILTARCNLACRHCYVSSRAWHDELRTERILKLIDEAHDLGVEYINFSGGEPLLREDIFDILAAAATETEVSLFTNLTLLDRRKAAMLSALGVFVLTSLDGATKRTHEEVRGPGTWDAFMRAVKLLRDEGVEFAPVFSISRSNAHEAGDFVRLAEEIGASSATLIPVMPFGRARESDLCADASACAKAIRSAEAAADEIGFPVSLWCMPFAGLIVTSRYVSWNYCRTSNGMDIGPSGDVLLCDVLDVAVSEVRTKGLSGAWRDVLSSPLVKEVETGDSCPGCPVGGACRGGCYARSYAARGAFSGPDPLCPRAARK